MTRNIGLYLHIPFCKSKCAYCDFFSGTGDNAAYDAYTKALIKSIALWGGVADESVTSVYFGGGTPSVLGTKRLCAVLSAVKRSFSVWGDAEITVEVNPESGKALNFGALRAEGFNRISVGLQSAIAREITVLGRIHTPDEAALTVRMAQNAGINNVSLDLMMGIPYQTVESLKRSIDFCAGCGVKHISSYLLKIEEGTRLYSLKEKLTLPDEDEQAEMYLFAAEYLEQLGYRQYEISNFAVPSFESRHNTLYWKCGEYIGLGPSAHSFYHGRRFRYDKSLKAFEENRTQDDGEGGGEEEFIMLALRLRSGLVFREYEQRFSKPLSPAFYKKIKLYADAGWMEADSRHACFTSKGFLVSNSILSELLL